MDETQLVPVAPSASSPPSPISPPSPPLRRTDRSRHDRRLDMSVWTGFGLLGTVFAAYVASLLIQGRFESWPVFNDWGVAAFEIAGSALCIARGLTRRPGRAVALTLGAGLAMWALGDLVMTITSQGGAEPATPSLADAFLLGFFPFTYVAVVIFMRGELRRIATFSWLDGAVAGAGAAAVCAAFAFDHVRDLAGGTPIATVTNMAYPIGDVLLLSLVVGGSTVMTGRRKAPWILIAVGNAVNVVGDTANLFSASWGHVGFVLDAVAWPASILVLSMSVWLRPRPADPFAPQKASTFVVPGVSAACALVILVFGNLHTISRVAVSLAAATLLLVGLRLVVSVRAMRLLSQERQRQAVTDELTGLGNRRSLFRVLDAFFGDNDASGVRPRSLAFLFMDLDRFKEINDTFGHPAGDELLKQLGPRLAGCLRDDDMLIRLGGDEFVALLVDGDTDYATAVAERLTAGLVQPFLLGAVSASVTASIGIALAPTDAVDSASLLWCADIAMYRAKLAGVPFETYQPDIDKMGNRVQLLADLQTAIDEHQLVLYYQPQLDLRSGKITAVEALLRWVHPRLGVIPPLEFLPFAEEAGLMGPITTLVLTDAITQCAAWRSAGHLLSVSVNVSVTNLLDPLFTTGVSDLLTSHGLPPEALVVEITETTVISDFGRSQRVIQELWDLGIVVSVDDFGAGFTSLAHLSSLAVKELKLDRTFISGLGTGKGGRDLDLVRATIDLGHALGLRIVAEGIEDVATLELLTRLGCDLGQGYLISIPKPASHVVLLPEPASRLPVPAVG
jgi:diguanylate cyclase